MNLAVDVVSDVICPWCFIGKRRLEKAIAALEGQHEVRVRWHPFQLNPTLPREGISRREYRIKKFGSWQRSQELDATVIAVGLTEGITFAFDKIERTPNTVDAHRLIWLADQHGCQDAVVEGLFQCYFSDGRDIGQRQNLIDVVVEAGLERAAVTTVLNSDQGLEVIADAAAMSQQHGVSGVPFFIINQQIAVSGAQQSETFLEAFQQVLSSSKAL